MTHTQEIKSWLISISISVLVFFLSIWIERVSRFTFGSKTSMGEGNVIEITLPPMEEPQEVRQKVEKPSPQKVERREVKRTVKEIPPQKVVRESPPQQEAERPVEKPTPPIPQEQAIVEQKAQQGEVAKEVVTTAKKSEEASSDQKDTPRSETSGGKEKEEQATAKAQESSPRPVAQPKGEQNELINYYIRIRALIERNKRYPEEAKRRGQEGTVIVRIKIKEDGSLGGVSLVKSSGYSSLDDETIRIVRSVGRFPPPPTGKPMEFNLEVEYKLGG